MARATIIVLLSTLLTVLFAITYGQVQSDTKDTVVASEDITADEIHVQQISDDFSDDDSDEDVALVKGYKDDSYLANHGGHYDGDGARHYYDDDYNKYDKFDGDYKRGKYNYYDKHNKYGNYGKYDKYDKNDKHDKFDKYDKYGKNDKYDKDDKEEFYGYKNEDKYGGCTPKDKSYECVAYFATVVGTEAQLWQSINGEATTLSSIYKQDDVTTDLAVFSNRARGAYCATEDIEMMVGTSTDTYLSRFEVQSVSGASRIYTHETGLIADGGFAFVTRILLQRMYKIIDAYFVEFEFGFAQYDINVLTNTKVSISFPQSICFDTAFFKGDNSRFVCQGQSGSIMSTYSRDPETGVNFVPPASHNPWVVGRGIYYTSVRLCKKNYISSIGYEVAAGVIIARAKFSLKYPYFKDIEEIWSDVGAINPNHIYTPPHTNTIYACIQNRFLRFDNAYTAEAPISPSVDSDIGQLCFKILSFNRCPNQVYVITQTQGLRYSPDGGVSWSDVELNGNTVWSSTGLEIPIKDYY